MIIGLEQEFFTVQDGKLVVCPAAVAHDGAGWLAEARGKTHLSVDGAVYSLLRFIRRLHQDAELCDVELDAAPYMRVPVTVRNEARRHYVKDLHTERNLYGHERHRVGTTYGTAGIHVSITRPEEVRNSDGVVMRTINTIWDYAAFIREMDAEFADEIKDAKRRPGFYDIHGDGRFEYRSLPTGIAPERLITGIQSCRS